MIPFKELCEFLTNNQRNTWFYFGKDLLQFLTEEDKSLVVIDTFEDSYYECPCVRVFYPRSKYENRPLYKEEYNRLLQKALEKEDWNEVKKLKQRLRKEE